MSIAGRAYPPMESGPANSAETRRPQQADYSEIRQGWRLLLAATIGTGLGSPTLPFYSIGIFAPILARTFGWSFASIFVGLGMIPVVLLLAGPLVGYFVDRHGPRRVAAISLCGLGISYASLALSNGSLVQYYFSWAAIAITGIGATLISFTRAVTGAFAARRGLALGITLAGTGLFAFGVKPFGGWLLDLFGWRGAILVIGCLPLAIAVPAVLWGVPHGAPGRTALERKAASSGSAASGSAVTEVLRTRSFWLLIVSFVPISFANVAPIPHLENILRSAHVAAKDALALTSLVGIMMVVGRLIGGWLTDRLWAPLVGTVILICGALGCWMLSQPTLTHGDGMVSIMLLGFAGGVEGSLMSYLVSRYIGVRSYGVAYGTLFGVFAIGAGFGPSILGYVYDRTGSYEQIMRACAVLLLFAAGVLLCLGRYPGDDREIARAPHA